MRPGRLVILLIVCSCASSREPEETSSQPDTHRPLPDACFQDISLEEAISTTDGTESTVLAFFTTAESWAGRRMESNTWSSDEIADLVGEDLAILSCSYEEAPELFEQYDVKVAPMTIAFRHGREFERLHGYRTPAGILVWLGSVREGQARALRDEVIKAQELSDDDVDGDEAIRRYVAARELLCHRKFDLATPHYLWLWNNALTNATDILDSRHTFILDEIAFLTSAHLPAKLDFMMLIDELDDTIKTRNGAGLPWVDWALLSWALGDDQRLVDWYDRVTANGIEFDIEALTGLRYPISPLVSRAVLGSLMRAGRARDAGLSLTSPDQVFASVREGHTVRILQSKRELLFLTEQGWWTRFSARNELADMVTALFAACRDAEAARWADDFLSWLDDAESRVALVESATRHDATAPEYARWRAEAEQLRTTGGVETTRTAQ